MLGLLVLVATVPVASASMRGTPTPMPETAKASAGEAAKASAGALANTSDALRPLAFAASRGGCVRIQRFVVHNQCEKTVELKGWAERVPPGAERDIAGRHTDDLARISWRLEGGPWAYDYIELNGDWRGAGTEFCSHPNYASWYGFTTSSRYEALDPQTGGLACADAGAEVTFQTATCPAQRSSALACDFRATQASIRSCASAAARYQEAHTFCINGDGSRTPKCACSPSGEWCGNWVNYPCAPESADWPNVGVGTWIDCTQRGLSITLKLTTCI